MFTQLQTNRQRYRQRDREWNRETVRHTNRSTTTPTTEESQFYCRRSWGSLSLWQCRRYNIYNRQQRQRQRQRWRWQVTPARYSYTHTHAHTQCNRYLELLYLIDTFGSEGQLQLTPFARALLLAQLKVTPRKSRNGKGKRMNANEENYYRCSLRSLQFSSSFCAIFPHLTNAIIICYNFRQAKVGPGLA